jgi:radical SAM superfamily enzyme YgiQ (UPF0313 family)
MKIKLILAASETDPLRKNDPFMPLSLAILAGSAPGHEYTFIDMLWEDDVRFDEPADVVGISMRYTAEKRAYEIADEFRRRGVKVILGGAQVTAVPKRAKMHADAVAVGEGEPLWPVIVRDIERGELKQFYVCSPHPFDAGGDAVFHLRSFYGFENTIIPNRSLFKKKYVFDTVYAVRGCPINCDFCSVTDMYGPECRTRPAENVVSEIDTFKNYYYLLDDTVFGRPATYDYYLNLYSSILKLKKRRFWTGQANLDAASDPKGRSVIEMAAKAGLIYAAIGMESINPATLKSSGAIGKIGVAKGDDPIAKMKENIRYIQDCGIIVSGWFVIGYENDTIDTYYRTIEFCREMNIIPAIFPVKVLPGTRLYRRLLAENKIDDSKQINFINPSINDQDVYRALKDIFAVGYSQREICKRTAFYWKKFKGDKIHKTIFALVLQNKLSAGIDVSNDEFYVEGE